MVWCCFCLSSNSRTIGRCTIVLLDDTEIEETVQGGERGEHFLQRICNRLDLLETAYFGLRYLAKDGQSRWLDPEIKVSSQLKGAIETARQKTENILPNYCSGIPSPHTLYFGVKFYASDPCKLVEEVTRYQFVLQLKQDILQGRLPVNEDLAAELFALSLQAELGDYDSRRHPHLYSSEFRFVPNQSQRMEEKAEKLHKVLRGQVPSSVEMKFLEKVKWLDLYGVDLHAVTGDKDVRYFLGLTPSGILVVKDGQRVNNFFWPRIIRVFFKGKRLSIKVRDKANDETAFTFLLPSRQCSEYLWRCCVEHHSFFRLTQVKDYAGNPMYHLFRLGSRHRYSGRTEHQALLDGRKSARSSQKFDRMPSRRRNRRAPVGGEKEPVIESGRKSSASEPSARLIHQEQKHVADDLDILHQRLSSELGTLYRSVSTPAVLAAVEQKEQSDIPPWEDPEHCGLFSSRYSLASSRGSERRSRHRRSGSVDSNDSRRRRHRGRRRCSDNDSDISRSSRGSRSGRDHHRRYRSHSRGGSGSDSDSQHKSRRRKHRQNGSNYNLVDSETQWKMVQKQKTEQQSGSGPRYQNAVVRDLSSKKSGYVNSGIDTESEAPAMSKKKHRRRSRSRSRSPESGPVLSHDVKKHIEYRLVDPKQLTEEEKKNIKYTRVESEASVYKIRCSPSAGKHKYKVFRVSSSRSSLDKKQNRTSDPFDKANNQRR